MPASDALTAEDGKGRSVGDDASELPRGTTIDRYMLIERIGKGGMGVVYSAYDHALHRRVAIKLVGGAGDDSAHDQLVAEARAMAQLAHPAIVPVYDVGTFRHHVFLAMAFVGGGTLRAWQQVERPARDILAMYVAIGGGLAFAHDEGVVHRDFKPDNVLLDRDGRPAITDFGLAKLVPDPGASMPLPAATHTISGRAAGTPGYMSPQQRRGEPTDAHTDQYAFCVSLFEALHGTLPDADPPPRADLPRRVLAAIRRGMADEPSARWPSMRALLAELAPPRPRRRAIAAVAVAGAACIVAATILGARSGAARETCSAPGAREMWDAARPTVAAALATAPRDGGNALVTALDGWTDAWTDMAVSSCRATERAVQSPQLLDLRTRCLDHALDVTRSLVDRARTPDRELAANAEAIAQALPRLAACADTAGLLGITPPPADPARRAAIDGLRARLAAVEALVATESYAAANAQLDALVPDIERAAYPPLAFEALATRATLEVQRDRDPTAAAEAAWAAIAAEPARTDYAVAAVWLDLVWIVAEMQHEPARALELGRVADAVVTRVHDGDQLGVLDYRLGDALVGAGRLDDATKRYERALALLDAAHDDREAIAVLQGEAIVASLRGDHVTEVARDEQAVARARRVPHGKIRLATVLNTLANAYREAARLDEAGAALREAGAIVGDGRDVPSLAASLHANLALVAEARGDVDTAADEYAQQLAFARLLDPDSSDLEIALYNVARAAWKRHRDADAVAPLHEALALLARLPASAVAGGAYIATPGKIALSLVSAQIDHPADALADAERALALVERDGLGPAASADAHRATAEAMWASGDHARARDMARVAAAEHRSAGDPDAATDDEHWLATH